MPEKINEKLAIASEEGEILKDLVLKEEPDVILEVGTGHGYSTHCMSKVMKKDAVMYSVDIDPKYIPYEISANVVFSNHTAERFVEEYTLKKKIDFVFLDSDHQIHRIVNDINILEPILERDVTIAVHDTNYCPEMGLCLADYFNGVSSERLDMVDVKPSKDKWIYKNYNTEYGLGVAKRGEK